MEFYIVEFIYTPNPDEEEPIMLINTHIGLDDKGIAGIMGDIFQRELLELRKRGKKVVDVWINTVGGGVIDGQTMYGTITECNASNEIEVNTLNIGIAASTGGWVFQAGKKRVMLDYSSLMMHDPHGKGDDEGKEVFTNSIATMLASRANKSKEEVLSLMSKTTFMNADEAFKNGFCDEVKPCGYNDLAAVTNVMTDRWEAGNTILNLLLPTQEKTDDMSYKTIANFLKLNDEASETAVLKGVQELSNRAETAEKAKNDMEDEMKNLRAECDKLKNDYEDKDKKLKDMEDAVNKAKSDKEAAEKAQNEVDCQNMVKGFAEVGRIKNDADTIAKWTNTGLKVGKDELKTMLEDLPLNKQAPKIEFKNHAEKPKSMSAIMREKETANK